jgi:hypothetical protein
MAQVYGPVYSARTGLRGEERKIPGKTEAPRLSGRGAWVSAVCRPMQSTRELHDPALTVQAAWFRV